MRRLLFPALLVFVACSAGQPSAREEQPAAIAAQAVPAAPGSGATFYREGLTRVDLSGLDAVAKERALQILNGNSCDCGCGMTIAQCLVKDQKCNRSPQLAKPVVDAIRAGKTDQQALADLKGTSNPAPSQAPQPNAPPQPVAKVDIDLKGAPSVGPDKAAVTVVAFGDFQ